MESVTSTSRKRYQTGRGAVGLATEETVQKRIDMESSAEELYLDVRDGARSPLEYRKDFALDVSKIQWVRVKRGVFRPTPVGFHDTNRPLSKDHLPASSLDKTRPSSNKLAARALRKMASRYANPSTPLARIGRLEYQFNQNPADNLQPKKADNTSIRAHDSLEHKPDLKSSSSFTQHRHHTAVATKQQPVEDARPTRRWSSDGLARHSRRGDSDVKTKDAAKDVERNNLHLELDRLSKGLGPQSVHNVRSILLVVANKADLQHSLNYSGLVGRSTTLYRFEIPR